MMQLRPYQNEAVTAIRHEWEQGKQRTLLVLPTGCHAVGQRLLMHNGESRAVEDIQVGDHLMGPDGTPRTVLYRNTGTGRLYSVMPRKGDPFIVTGDHLLTLARTSGAKIPQHSQYIDVTVADWLGWSRNRKHLYKLVRCSGVSEFFGRGYSYCPIDPYFLGILLGDGGLSQGVNITTADPEVANVIRQQAQHYGYRLRQAPAGKATTWFFCKDVSDGALHDQLRLLGLMGHTAGDKFVPDVYKYAPICDRLQIIAGLIDADGYLRHGGYDYITKSRQLAEDLVFMCRSVGLAAYINWCWKYCGKSIGSYFRVSISGDCSRIPCRVKRRIAGKRRQNKDVLRTSFSVHEIEEGSYIGFTVDGDNRYLLDDFTITHNCGKTIVMADVADKAVQEGGRVLIMAHRGELLTQAADKLRTATGLESAIEKAESTSLGSMFPVTVGSVQSLCRERRLSQFPGDYFSTILVDEAHHCLADSYQRVLEHFPRANVLGVTATPDKLLKKQMGTYFDSLAYEYTMR